MCEKSMRRDFALLNEQYQDLYTYVATVRTSTHIMCNKTHSGLPEPRRSNKILDITAALGLCDALIGIIA